MRVGFHLQRFWGQGGSLGGRKDMASSLSSQFSSTKLGNGILLVELNGFTGRSKVLDPIKTRVRATTCTDTNRVRTYRASTRGVNATESTVSLRNQTLPKINHE